MFGSVVDRIIANAFNLVSTPSWENFISLTTDLNSYMIMPLEGGYTATYAHMKYKEDERAYEDAGVSEMYLFTASSNLFKEKYWQLYGIFSRVTESQLAAIDFSQFFEEAGDNGGVPAIS